MELRLTLDDDLITEMMVKSGTAKVLDLTREALSILYWAINEVSDGRIIVSADANGGSIRRLSMSTLKE